MKLKILIGIFIILNIVLAFRIFKVETPSVKYIQRSDNSVPLIPLKTYLKESYSINGKSIPDINLKNLKNENVHLKSFLASKKTILLIYSEVSCNACVDSLILHCNQLADKTQNNYQVVGIAYSSDIEYLRRFGRINALTFPILWDPNKELSKNIRIESLPAVFMIDESGKIINSFFISPSINKLNSVFFDAASAFIKKVQ